MHESGHNKDNLEFSFLIPHCEQCKSSSFPMSWSLVFHSDELKPSENDVQMYWLIQRASIAAAGGVLPIEILFVIELNYADDM